MGIKRTEKYTDLQNIPFNKSKLKIFSLHCLPLDNGHSSSLTSFHNSVTTGLQIFFKTYSNVNLITKVCVRNFKKGSDQYYLE